jgi:hypothetical protein
MARTQRAEQRQAEQWAEHRPQSRDVFMSFVVSERTAKSSFEMRLSGK